MTFGIITHVIHTVKEGKYFAYSPYVNEMNLWGKYIDKIIIVAPVKQYEVDSIHAFYNHPQIEFIALKSFDITSLKNILISVLYVLYNLVVIFKAMLKMNHIHLRCPGNIGLLGCIVQILFPKKKKTAKYAGNWDPKAKQPLSYKFQRWILSNTFLTKNIQVLVYGDWSNQTKNIKSFFTATYGSAEIQDSRFETRELKEGMPIRFLFVGALVKGKQPLYAIELVKKLKEKGYNVLLELYGEGIERTNLEKYLKSYNLQDFIVLKGNQTKDLVLQAYLSSHFLILPSKSEGWPKVVAEAMFWGCVPLATSVSCVPYMLDYGNRGVLLKMEVEVDTQNIISVLDSNHYFTEISERAKEWSRQFTTDKFEQRIKELLVK